MAYVSLTHTVYQPEEPMMLKSCTFALAAIAVTFSLTAYGADQAPKKSASPSAPATQAAADTPAPGIAQELAENPAKFLRASVQADNMGYIYAVVANLTNLSVANVYVRVVHFDATTRQPDNQSDPLLVAANIAPREGAQLKLEGVQAFKQADLQLYRVFVVRAELAK